MRDGYKNASQTKAAGHKAAAFEPSSGNVFEDMGVSNPNLMLAKADLVIQIEQIAEDQGLSSAQTAKKLGLTQQKLTQLKRGHTKEYTLDDLYQMLESLGQRVQITVIPIAKTKRLKR